MTTTHHNSSGVDLKKDEEAQQFEQIETSDGELVELTPDEDHRILRKIDLWYATLLEKPSQQSTNDRTAFFQSWPRVSSRNSAHCLHKRPLGSDFYAGYLFQFLDKSALGYTAILGLNTDLNLSGQDFSWASAIYYLGYLAASYPAGWLIVRYPVAKVIACSVWVRSISRNATPMLTCADSFGALSSCSPPHASTPVPYSRPDSFSDSWRVLLAQD